MSPVFVDGIDTGWIVDMFFDLPPPKALTSFACLQQPLDVLDGAVFVDGTLVLDGLPLHPCFWIHDLPPPKR